MQLCELFKSAGLVHIFVTTAETAPVNATLLHFVVFFPGHNLHALSFLTELCPR